MKKLLLVATMLLLAVSCTDNARTRNFGGVENVELQENEKFLNITWKDTNLWIITQDTLTGTYYAREKSSLGMMQGVIVINPRSVPQSK